MLRICILSAAARLQVAGYVIVKTVYLHTYNTFLKEFDVHNLMKLYKLQLLFT